MRRDKIKAIIIALTMSALCAACATSKDPRDPRTPRRQLTSCPPGQYLVCVSQQPRKPSQGGAEEEVPLYDRCTCESSI